MFKTLNSAFARAALVAAAMTGAALASPDAVRAQSPRVAMWRAPSTPVIVSPPPKFHHPLAGPADATAVPSTLNYPYGLTVDNAGTLYVANVFGGVTIYNDKGGLMGTITSGLSFPVAVAVSFEGNIYVANNGGNNITVYNQSLTQIGTITDPALVQPTSMFIDADDEIWVLDSSGTVHLYTLAGTPLSRVTTGGSAIGPWGPNVTVWGVSDGAGGYNELFQNRADAARNGASFLNGFPGSPKAGAEAQDGQGQEYVTDLVNNTIEIWGRNGEYKVGLVPLPGAASGVAVDPSGTHIYAAITGANEVLEFSSKPPFKLVRTIH